MTYDYLLTLKKEKRRSIDAVSVLMILVSIAAFLTLLSEPGYRRFVLATIAVVLVFFLIRAFLKKTGKKNFRFMLLAAGLTWLAMPFTPWVGVPLLLLALLEKPAKMPVTIAFSRKNIVIRNFFHREISWQSCSNVLLKDGLLTLDFKDNRILQREIIEDGTAPDERQFNAFCLQQLSVNK